MFARLILIFQAFLLAFPFTAYAAGPLGSIRVGQWGGGAYTNDATGAFSHCAAAVPYLSGIVLIVGMGANHQWTLGFAHPAWNLTPGESIPIGLTFDGREQYNVFGPAQTPSFGQGLMRQNPALLNQFRK